MSNNLHKAALTGLSSLLLLVGIASCKPSIPSKYLQPDEMEDVLYDYHLAMSMANNERDAAVKQRAYQQAVFKKYDITEQQFDTSLQYYIRHTEKLKKIYEDISKRYENEARLQGASENDLHQFGNIKSKGDTTDIWQGRRTLLLSPYALLNQHNFTLKADSSYHKGDRFVFRFDAQFIIQDGMRDAVALLAVTFSNDSIATKTQHIYSSGQQTLTIENHDTLGIKSVKGYFVMLKGQQPSSTFKLLILQNVELVRMHIHKASKEELRADSLKRKDPIRTIGGDPVSIPQTPAVRDVKIAKPTAKPQRAMLKESLHITQ